jgi:leucyl aminopeptidase
MITMTVSDHKITMQNTAAYLFVVPRDFTITGALKEFAGHYFPDLNTFLSAHHFTGTKFQTFSHSFLKDDQVIHVLLVGLGSPEEKRVDIETYRRALGLAYKKLIAQKVESVTYLLPAPALFGATAEYLAKQTAIIFEMTAYHFDEYITDKERKEAKPFDLTIIVNTALKKEVSAGIKIGKVIAHATNQARHWVDLPPTVLTPVQLADKAQIIAKEHNLKITVFSEEQINEMGMQGLVAVSRGSHLDCRLVIMEYKTKKKNAPTVAFVGKGITFDSGGLSLKPASAMETMKEDMSGAAAVISTMEVLAQLKPDINVIGIAPVAENLPDAEAVKPGDIVRFYNGKTAEIKNTDAEGRLILADALSYAVKHYKLDAIIDLATLTGACAYALGPFYSGLMSQHDDVVERMQQAAVLSGERVWRLPMNDDFKPAIKSPVADLCNSGSNRYRAGAITAAHFLQNFVDDVPWAHLDIAGTAFDVPDIPYYRSGATGVGVRLLVELAMNWK